jgi:hypothetical protein
MPLEFHENDNAREAKPSFLFFQGKNALYFLFGVFIFITLFRVFSKIGFGFIANAVISSIPLGLITVFVLACVNGKPNRYPFDLIEQCIFLLKAILYQGGWLDQPPAFWKPVKTPPHPNEFSRRASVN